MEKAGPDGIPWNAGYDRVDLLFPRGMFPAADYEPRLALYYDEIQDLLSEKYCTVW